MANDFVSEKCRPRKKRRFFRQHMTCVHKHIRKVWKSALEPNDGGFFRELH